MTLFRDPKSWNFGLGENYLDYIRRRSLAADITGDIKEIQKASAREIAGMVSDQTRAILLGMDALKRRASEQMIVVKAGPAPAYYDHTREIDLLCQCFGQGIATLSTGLDNISRGISDLNSTFQWGFSEILGSLGGIQDTLDKLLKAVKNQTRNAAYEHFDIARDAFRQKLYPECLESLEKAIGGDHVSSGYKLEWRFHLLRGIVRLGSGKIPENLINLAEAEQSFLLAARYAWNDKRHEAAKAMMQAGWAAFAQHKLEEARKHTDQALALNPNLAEALYNAAKFAFAAKDSAKGLQHISKAIDIDAGYIAKADTDGDFSLYRKEMLELFEMKRQDMLQRISNPEPVVASFFKEWGKSAEELKRIARSAEAVRTRFLVKGELGFISLRRFLNVTLPQVLEMEGFAKFVVVDCGKSLTTMLGDFGRYDGHQHLDQKIIERFSVKGSGKKEVKLCHVKLQSGVTINEVLEHMDLLGLKPARIEHLLFEDGRGIRLIALGSAWFGADGVRYVPYRASYYGQQGVQNHTLGLVQIGPHSRSEQSDVFLGVSE